MQRQRSLSVEDDDNIELSDVQLLLKFRDFQSFWWKKGRGRHLNLRNSFVEKDIELQTRAEGYLKVHFL